MNGNRNTYAHCMQTRREWSNVTPAANGIWSGTLMSDILSAGGIIPPGMKWTTSGHNASPATSTTKGANMCSPETWIERSQELRNASTYKVSEAGSGNAMNCNSCTTTTKGRRCACNRSKDCHGPEVHAHDEIEEQARWDQGTRELMKQRRNLFAKVVEAPVGSHLQAKLSGKIERLSARIYARTGDERFNPSTNYRFKYDK